MTVGYFEGFNDGRECLNMAAEQIPTTYSHIHFSFAEVTFDFQVDVLSISGSFKAFVAQTGFKKVLSFGGWSFSTSAGSYAIFREGVTDANRLRFAQSVVAVVADNNLDGKMPNPCSTEPIELTSLHQFSGVDFDWEYPGKSNSSRPLLYGQSRKSKQISRLMLLLLPRCARYPRHSRRKPDRRCELLVFFDDLAISSPSRQNHFDCCSSIVLVFAGLPYRRHVGSGGLYCVHDL